MAGVFYSALRAVHRLHPAAISIYGTYIVQYLNHREESFDRVGIILWYLSNNNVKNNIRKIWKEKIQMNMFKKMIIPSVLAVALIVPVTAYAAASSETQSAPNPITNQAQIRQLKDDPAKGYGHRGHHFSKRCFMLDGGVHQQMYLTLLAEKYAPETSANWQPVLAERNRLQEEFKALFKSNPSGWKKSMRAKSKEEMIAKRQKQMEVYNNFEAAIKSKDAAKIKTAMSILLENFKKHNVKMAEKLVELKKQAVE